MAASKNDRAKTPAPKIERAKREAEEARRRLDTTIGALQQRLNPKTLATDAWDGVKEKGNDFTDNALQVVKDRPATVSMALAAFTLFLARRPIGRAVSRLWAEEEQPDGRIVTQIDSDTENYNVTAPRVTEPVGQGVN